MLKKLIVLLSLVATTYGQPVTTDREYLKMLISTSTGGDGDTLDFFEPVCAPVCGTGYVCVDGHCDECTDGSDNCGTGYVCVDGHCNDVDECAAGSDNCGTSSTCSNTEGGFTCVVRRRLKDNTLRNCLMFIIFIVIVLAALICSCQPSNLAVQVQVKQTALVPPTDGTKSLLESPVQSLYF